MTQLKIFEGTRRAERVAALRLPAADEVEALVELGQQPRDLGRVVLEVGVDRHDDVALGVREARRQRRCLAEVPAQADRRGRCPARCAAGSAPRTSRRSSRRRRRPPPRAGRAAGARTPARRRGAPPSAPRRERGRRPRSRRLSLSAARTVCGGRGRAPDSRGSPAPRARARPRRCLRRRFRSSGRRAACSPRPRARWSICRRSRARRWTGSPLRAADTPGTLPVVVAVAAGRPAPRRCEPGEAMGIATGGVVPEGADAVIPVEYVVDHDNEVEIAEAVEPGANVRPRGGDLRAGDEVVAAGTRLGPAQLGALAAAGVAEVACGALPRAAVLATGTELRRPGEPLGAGRDLRGQRADPRRSAQVGGRSRRAPGGCRRRRGRAPRGARARARARRARHLGRRLRRPARSRPRDRGRARRRRGLLARGREAGQAGLVRRARARRSCSGCRETRSRRWSVSSCSSGRRCWPCRVMPTRCPGSSRGGSRLPRDGTRPATSWCARGPEPATMARSSSSR